MEPVAIGRTTEGNRPSCRCFATEQLPLSIGCGERAQNFNLCVWSVGHVNMVKYRVLDGGVDECFWGFTLERR